MEHALICPQCNAPLSPPNRFTRSTVCPYCGVVVQFDEPTISATHFHEAFQTWNSPTSYQISSWISIGDRHWGLEKFISHSEIVDVYVGRLARWPTELVVIKILHDDQHADFLLNEWDTLKTLHKSEAPGTDTFSMLLPQPISHGKITNGMFVGKYASIFRRAIGFDYTFEDVMRQYPQGIPPRASIWVWRRILEMLSFIHSSGIVHGAVLPDHLRIQKNEHGVRLENYIYAGRPGEKLHLIPSKFDSFYPQFAKTNPKLLTQLDIVMSARCIVAILGGNPETGSLADNIPSKLVEYIQRVALSQTDGVAKQNAWAMRVELGQIAKEIFGPPQYIPIVMPD